MKKLISSLIFSWFITSLSLNAQELDSSRVFIGVMGEHSIEPHYHMLPHVGYVRVFDDFEMGLYGGIGYGAVGHFLDYPWYFYGKANSVFFSWAGFLGIKSTSMGEEYWVGLDIGLNSIRELGFQMKNQELADSHFDNFEHLPRWYFIPRINFYARMKNANSKWSLRAYGGLLPLSLGIGVDYALSK